MRRACLPAFQRFSEDGHLVALDEPIGRVMTASPTSVRAGTRLRDAVALIETRRLSELPVIQETGRVVGLLDIVDLVGMLPPEMLEILVDPSTAATA